MPPKKKSKANKKAGKVIDISIDSTGKPELGSHSVPGIGQSLLSSEVKAAFANTPVRGAIVYGPSMTR